jgi:hypothetical protein
MDSGRNPLCFERRYSVADDAERFPALENRIRPFQQMEQTWHPGKCLDRLTAYHRLKEGQAALPSYGIIDAQCVKTQYASEERGIDSGKKVKGHKRHIVVDILGNLL